MISTSLNKVHNCATYISNTGMNMLHDMYLKGIQLARLSRTTQWTFLHETEISWLANEPSNQNHQ